MTPPLAAFAVDVSSRWDAIFEPSARAALERVLPDFIARRRWYRTKTKGVESARVRAAFPFPYSHERAGATARVERVARITLVEVGLDDGTRDTYVLPLAFVSGGAAERLEARRPQALVLPLRISDGAARARGGTMTGFIVDGVMLDEVAVALLRAILRGGVVEDDGRVLTFHPLRSAREAEGRASITPRLVEAEQTNTSVLYGDLFVGKLLRKLDRGESPDLEVVRFLTDAGYTHVPPIAGWVDVREPGDPRPSTVALLQVFAQSRGDAWTHAQAVLDRWLARAAERSSSAPALEGDLLARASAPLAPEVAAIVGDYGALAELLGRRVGEMHALLASRPDLDAFRPEALDARARGEIAAAARADLERAITHLGARSAELPGGARDALAELRSRLSGLEARLGGAARAADGGVRIRVHGDLHLGQVLFTGNDFVLIDFEGEPARSIEERRSKRSPFVDVAGMLRSLHYAVVAALRDKPASTRAGLAGWADLWHRAVTASFLRGWLRAVRGSVVVPREPEATRALLDLFLVEKAVYELRYELDNRPDWVDIPLAGLREIAEAADGSVEASRLSTR